MLHIILRFVSLLWFIIKKCVSDRKLFFPLIGRSVGGSVQRASVQLSAIWKQYILCFSTINKPSIFHNGCFHKPNAAIFNIAQGVLKDSDRLAEQAANHAKLSWTGGSKQDLNRLWMQFLMQPFKIKTRTSVSLKVSNFKGCCNIEIVLKGQFTHQTYGLNR